MKKKVEASLKREKAKERREKRRHEISLLRSIPYSHSQRWWCSNTVAVVTGGSKGIGFEIVRQLADNGLTVVFTSRDPNVVLHPLHDNNNVVSHPLDVSDPLSVHQFANWVRDQFGGIDILVNNAGVNFNLGYDNSVENAETVVSTNYYGTKNMTKAMLPLMRPSAAGARIVNVSSRLGRLNGRRNRLADKTLREKLSDLETLGEELIDETVSNFLEQVKDGSWTSGGWPQTFTDYSVSKLAVNAYTRLIAKTLSDRPEGEKIYVNCFCPGWVKTAMTGWAGNISPDEAADTGVWLALLPDQSVTGTFFAERREINF